MTVSIAMATYNGARFLQPQLDSFVAQTRRPDELIVCDDQSTDATSEVLARFAATAPFPVRVEVNPVRLRVSKNFERAVSLCSGDIIALSDQDDVWLPHKLQRLEDTLAAHPDVGMVFSDAEAVDDAGAPLGYRLWRSFNIGEAECRKFHEAPRRGLDALVGRPLVTGATMAFRSRYRNFVLPIPTERTRLIHDGWIALAVSALADVLPIEEPLVLYRQHASQQIGARVPVGAANRSPSPLMRYGLSHMISDLTLLSQRLAERPDAAPPGLAETIREWRAHLEVRAEVQATRRRLQRITPVAREWTSGRYRTFSNGFSSVVKDLTLPPESGR